jgi:hypothetical protein
MLSNSHELYFVISQKINKSLKTKTERKKEKHLSQSLPVMNFKNHIKLSIDVPKPLNFSGKNISFKLNQGIKILNEENSGFLN